MDGDLFKKTLKTMGVMLASWVAFVGSLTVIALLVVSSAVGSSKKGDGHDEAPGIVPASKIDGQRAPETAPAQPKFVPKKVELPPGATRPT